MNHLKDHTSLKNRYYVMRHGESKANVAGIIISYPKNGVKDEYALSDKGREQAKLSAENSSLKSETLIYCSDFSRAKQTADIVAEALHAEEPVVTTALRERYFGDFEEQSKDLYQAVWKHDIKNPHHTEFNVEAVAAVLKRATELILNLEEAHTNRDILLVSHGDTLQILQTAFEGVDAHGHRSLFHLETAEIRPITLAR